MPKAPAPAEVVTFLSRDRLQLPPENPKYPITRDKLDGLKASIQLRPRMMLSRPIGVSDGPVHKMGGFVWGGNQRVLALEELYREGWTPPDGLWPAGLYPCSVQDLDPDTAREWLLTDNRQFAEFDPSRAVRMLDELKAKGRDPRTMGWDQEQMNALMEKARSIAPGPPPAPPADPGTLPPEPDEDEEGPDGEDEDHDPEASSNGSANGTAFLDEHAAAGDPDQRWPSDAQPPELDDDLNDFALRITVAQRDTIMRAVHTQRRRNPDQTTAEALTTVCQEWFEQVKPNAQA